MTTTKQTFKDRTLKILRSLCLLVDFILYKDQYNIMFMFKKQADPHFLTFAH